MSIDDILPMTIRCATKTHIITNALCSYCRAAELEALIQEAAGCTEREWYSTVQRKIRAANVATLASQSDRTVKPA